MNNSWLNTNRPCMVVLDDILQNKYPEHNKKVNAHIAKFLRRKASLKDTPYYEYFLNLSKKDIDNTIMNYPYPEEVKTFLLNTINSLKFG